MVYTMSEETRNKKRVLYSLLYPDINQAHGTGSGNNYNLSQTIITGVNSQLSELIFVASKYSCLRFLSTHDQMISNQFLQVSGVWKFGSVVSSSLLPPPAGHFLWWTASNYETGGETKEGICDAIFDPTFFWHHLPISWNQFFWHHLPTFWIIGSFLSFCPCIPTFFGSEGAFGAIF